ncbi:hypothetical protein FQR65_LT20637 [Abscondita terminalis]|nr:hypothetical protein FQR65_LT20637 [Abscondita terminalis]
MTTRAMTTRATTLPAMLRAGGGILPVRTLAIAGFTPHTIRRALATGSVMRPQRGWIALPDTANELLHAAQHGVILSCVSATHRYGLWRRKDSGWHFATPSRHSNTKSTHTIHWRKPVRRREPGTLVDPLENALNYVAYCQPPEEALAIWESALHNRLVTLDALRRYPLGAGKLCRRPTPGARTAIRGSSLHTRSSQRFLDRGMAAARGGWLNPHWQTTRSR